MEPFDDPVLGHFVWDATGNEWRGELVTPDGIRIEITVDCEREAISPADREAYAWLRNNERTLRDQLAERMLELAKDWREGRDDPEEPEITVASFAERVELLNAAVNEGEFHLTYSDGEMFGGHAIVVSVGADHTMGDPALWG